MSFGSRSAQYEGMGKMLLDEDMIFKYLGQTGIKYGNKGFFYCAVSIKMASENMQPTINIGEIYKKIAEQYDDNPECVARAVRYALKPLGITNKEFLIRALYEIRYFAETQKESPTKNLNEKWVSV